MRIHDISRPTCKRKVSQETIHDERESYVSDVLKPEVEFHVARLHG